MDYKKAAEEIVRNSSYDIFSDVEEGSKYDREMYCLVNDIANLLASHIALAERRGGEVIFKAVKEGGPVIVEDGWGREFQSCDHVEKARAAYEGMGK